MTLDTIAVTGGNGTIGRAILDHLSEYDYETVNISRGKRREDVSEHYLSADLLDAGETYSALSVSEPDAVIHMGTIPAPHHNPDFRVYESNVMSAVHVLEAAESLGLESVCLPSSINAIGSEHQERSVEVEYLPVDESHPRTPDDPYGIAKHAMEVTADGFARRPSTELSISSVRYPWVPSHEDMRAHFVEADRSIPALRNAHPGAGRDALFSYIDPRDAAAIARNCVEAEFDDHEIFWAVASDTTADAETDDLIGEFFPDVEVRGSVSGHESLVDLSKANDRLDWEPSHSWRDLQ